MELTNIKLLLDITDTTQDGLLNLYVSMATDYILDELNLNTLPQSLNTLVYEMVVFLYRSKGVENLKSNEEGSLIETYITEYPPNILKRLQNYKDRNRSIRVIVT
ncbi:phage head-tail connector protein [Niallia sp. 01092]|uniref:phage head-tail connector protein n=1 Tax=Niallia sp. 01092 TaxID=3457759 RepID=UPI003FD538F9